MEGRLWALALGFALDLLVGDPEWFPHPVRLVGRFIRLMENFLRAHMKNLRIAAALLCAGTVALFTGAAALILWLLSRWGEIPLLIGMALLCWTCLAARNLGDEAMGVYRALGDGLPAARARVGRIVGRDTGNLSRAEVVRATVETVSENLCDGVVAPIVYMALGGPVLGVLFKCASTLDSMVGYLDERYREIGSVSARLDDVLNYLPARITALLMIGCAFLLGLHGKDAARIVRRDHKNHLSPNCAWSEAAAAGALGIQLGGAHRYFGKVIQKPTIGDDRRPPVKRDILLTVRLMYLSSVAAFLIAAATLYFI